MSYGKNVIFCAPAQMLEQPIRKEANAAEAITPGALVSLNGNGDFVNGSAGYTYVADKDHLAAGDIDTDYAVGDRVTSFAPTSGLVFNVLGKAADAFTQDAPVWPVADGTVTVTDPADGTAVIGHADEAITTAAGERVAIKFI